MTKTLRPSTSSSFELVSFDPSLFEPSLVRRLFELSGFSPSCLDSAALRLLAVVGRVEPRPFEADGRRREHLPQHATAGRADRQGLVLERLHDVEAVAAVAAQVLVGGHDAGSIRTRSRRQGTRHARGRPPPPAGIVALREGSPKAPTWRTDDEAAPTHRGRHSRRRVRGDGRSRRPSSPRRARHGSCRRRRRSPRRCCRSSTRRRSSTSSRRRSRAGLADILIITGRGKRTHRGPLRPLVRARALPGGEGQVRRAEAGARRSARSPTIHYIRQRDPLGPRDTRCAAAEAHVGGEPFAVLLGDDLIHPSMPLLARDAARARALRAQRDRRRWRSRARRSRCTAASSPSWSRTTSSA